MSSVVSPRRPAAALAALVLVLVAGCSTSSPATGNSVTPAAPTDTSSSSSTPPVTSSAPTPTATVSATPSVSHSVPALVYCTAAQLTVRVLPGGAAQGVEIAAATFTNSSNAACSLSGYPTVALLLAGQVRASASPAPGSNSTPVTLAPGKQAQALIEDTSSCNAPLSDMISVVAPNQRAGATAYQRPFQLRLCTVHVDPVSPAS